MAARSEDRLDFRLMQDWQRDLPVTARPFGAIADALGSEEADVIARLARLRQSGAVARVGATVRPNTLGASTLAALAAPEYRTEEIAALVCEEPGVNHAYLRENAWNIWFVATGPDRAHVDAALARIGRRAGLPVLDCPLERPYHIDLGFSLEGGDRPKPARPAADLAVLRPGDAALAQALTDGLPLIARPFAEIGRRLGRSEADILARIRALAQAGVLTRLGVIVRHRAIGWRANAMVVWDLPPQDVDRAGEALARQPGVTLCYRRRRHPALWPYNLYCMIHAKSRAEALEAMARASEAAGLTDRRRAILFSLRCFKQSGAMLTASGAAA